MQPQSARGVYVMDGADHDLDFGTSGVEGNILIVYPTDKKGNCTIYEFTQGAFYDTPECHQYVCRAGNNGLLHCSGKDTAFGLECANGRIIGLWRETTHGDKETVFYSRQEGKAAPRPAGKFFDEIRGVYAPSGNTGADSMIVVIPHYTANDRKELVITKIGHGFGSSAKGEKFIPVYKGKRIAQLRHSTQDGARTFDKIPLRFIYADKYYCEKAYTLSPEAYKAMMRGIIKKEGLRH